MTFEATLIINGDEIPVAASLRPWNEPVKATDTSYFMAEGVPSTWHGELVSDDQKLTATLGQTCELRLSDGPVVQVRIIAPELDSSPNVASVIGVIGRDPVPFA